MKQLMVQASVSVICHHCSVFQTLDKAKFCVLVLTLSLNSRI